MRTKLNPQFSDFSPQGKASKTSRKVFHQLGNLFCVIYPSSVLWNCKQNRTGEIMEHQSKTYRKHVNCSLKHTLWPSREVKCYRRQDCFLVCSTTTYGCSLVTRLLEDGCSVIGVNFVWEQHYVKPFLFQICLQCSKLKMRKILETDFVARQFTIWLESMNSSTSFERVVTIY